MKKVLYIESDKSKIEFLESVLSQWGLNVTHVFQCNYGIRLCRQSSFDLVFIGGCPTPRDFIESMMIFRQEFPMIKILGLNENFSEKELDLNICAKACDADYLLSKNLSSIELIDWVRSSVFEPSGYFLNLLHMPICLCLSHPCHI